MKTENTKCGGRPLRTLYILHFTFYILTLVGLTRVELVTSSLSGTRSNQLSYKPLVFRKGDGTLWRTKACRDVSTSPPKGLLLRKEVIQPLVPQRLPCYDFIPITTHTLG